MPELPREILEKLKNIRERTDTTRGVSPQEAENNMAILQRLLLKHNLEMVDLEADVRESTVTEEIIYHDSADDWKKLLIYILGTNNGCVILNDEAIFMLVGQPQNIVVVKELYNWLADELPKMAHKAWVEERKKSPLDGYPEFSYEPATFIEYMSQSRSRRDAALSIDIAWENPEEWRHSYINGVLQGFQDKLSSEKRAASTGDGDAKALMVLMDKDAKEYVDSKYKTHEEELVVKSSVRQAYISGVDVGKNISTEKQVYGTDSPMLGE